MTINDDDPVVEKFLELLGNDIDLHPERLQAVDAKLIQRARSLTGNIVVDINALLPDDDSI